MVFMANAEAAQADVVVALVSDEADKRLPQLEATTLQPPPL